MADVEQPLGFIVTTEHEMLELLPDLVVAFLGGEDTAELVQRAKVADVSVVEVR